MQALPFLPALPSGQNPHNRFPAAFSSSVSSDSAMKRNHYLFFVRPTFWNLKSVISITIPRLLALMLTRRCEYE